MVTRDRLPRLLDVNVMLALSLTNHVHHAVAGHWFEGVGSWATCPFTEAAYCRLLLNPRVVGFEIGVPEVLSGLRTFCAVKGHEFIEDSASLTAPLIQLERMVGHRQVTDFHLVDLAARSGAVLATLDARIPAALAKNDRRFVEVIPVD
ncbi:VapC toxin family PIN domain ribonuclease [Actinomyces sp. Z5]|uniref:TA system VapC family ribonuclease toxin n=1 Tax=Actinomyces sp. Z5 TaxID=2250216 RepID=UPI000DCB61E0|nr:TA system VapC family ribonuclease toxin [Actinomyces sp. Z5]RAX21546.1 VapC toxin family PIN domain ribonuclease [Actinomyces sp. Z5]